MSEMPELLPCPFCGGTLGPDGYKGETLIHDMRDEKQLHCVLAHSGYDRHLWNTRNQPPSPTDQERERALAEIRNRWATRSWPSIGYFVHGDAYRDIQKLLGFTDGK